MFLIKKWLFLQIKLGCSPWIFPKEVPSDMPDVILQISSGLYGVRTKEGKFDIERYKKQMSFL